MAVVAEFLLVVYALRTICAVTMDPCNTGSPLEVSENKTANIVTCNGIPGADYNVNWKITLPNSVSQLIVGVCIQTCTDFSNVGYKASRQQGTSIMTINPLKVKGGTTLTCEAVGTANTESTSCILDIISPPESVLCSVQLITSGSSFTVSGRCDVTKTYSSLNRYSCQWYTRQGSSAETTVGQPVTIVKTAENGATPTGGTYINGRCDVTMPWPIDDAAYSYTVVVTPGDGSQDAGTLAIRKPSPSHSCPQYVVEGETLTCTCAGDAGLPSAVLRWDTTGSSTLTVRDVKRSQNGTQYRCQAVLSGAVVQQVVYTLNVAYGPDTVTLNDPGVFNLNPASPGAMTLTCTASVSIPRVTYSWSRSCDGVTSGSTCMFTPTVNDHNTSITCTVTNTATKLTRTASRTITLNYPPSSAPTIINYSNDIFYAGDNLTLVCTVRGGKPLVTRVIFSCIGKQDGNDVSGQDDVSSSLTFIPLVVGDHGVNCTCIAEWKISGWYTLTATTRLTVFCAKTTVVPLSDALDKECAADAPSFGTGVGVGIVVGVACTVGVDAVIVVLWRRKVKLTNNTGSTRPPVTSMSSPEAMTEEAKEPEDYTESVSAGPYEALRLEDVGQRSLYEDLHKQTGVR